MSVQVHKVVVRVERPVNEIRAYRANSSFFFVWFHLHGLSFGVFEAGSQYVTQSGHSCAGV